MHLTSQEVLFILKENSIDSNDLIDQELLTVLGQGNDNPLQYSCLENPMDGGAW